MLISFQKFNLLIKKQKELDKIISDRMDPSNLKVINFKRKFALLIEISEFANEVKWFKYWSQKKPDFNKVKEELIDVIHFTLSISSEYIKNSQIDTNIFYNKINHQEVQINDKNIGQNFFELINLASDPQSSIINIWKYLNMFIEFFFNNEDQLMDFYNRKNAINAKRQTIDNY